MITETKEIYKCEFCRKVYQLKHFAVEHEKICSKNPDNFRACFGCSGLDESKIKIDTVNRLGEIVPINRNLFFCWRRAVYVYPAIVEHKGNAYNYWDWENHPMPKICELRQQKHVE